MRHVGLRAGRPGGRSGWAGRAGRASRNVRAAERPSCHPVGMSTALAARLQAALIPAMKAKDRARVSVLRSALAALANAEAVDASASEATVGLGSTEIRRREVSEAEAELIVRALARELRDAADEMALLHQPDEAATLRLQIEALAEFIDLSLPPSAKR